MSHIEIEHHFPPNANIEVSIRKPRWWRWPPRTRVTITNLDTGETHTVSTKQQNLEVIYEKYTQENKS
jgi:hypothetical protein